MPWLAAAPGNSENLLLGISEESKLLSADIEAEDDFGACVGFHADTAIIGVRSDDDACPLDPDCESGSAYIFERDPVTGAWVETAKLVASDATTHSYFGRSAAVWGDTAVVGSDLHEELEGGVYVYERDAGGPGAWGETVKLLPDNPAPNQQFGSFVAIEGDTLIAAARSIDTVFVFERDASGVWSQVDALVGSDVEPGHDFGRFLALDGNILLIGAQEDDHAGVASGSAYIYQRIGGVWTEITKIVADDAEPGDFFARVGDIDGDVAAVGAPETDDACPGVPQCLSGAVYIFQRDAGGPDQWGQVAKIVPDDTEQRAFFGRAVGLDLGFLAVGAPGDNDLGNIAGTLYVYQQASGDASAWNLVSKMAGADTAPGDRFGYAVASDGTGIAIGADFDDTVFDTTGSAYVFRVELGLSLSLAGACPGVVTISVADATADSRVLLFRGAAAGTTILGSGPCAGTELGIDAATRLAGLRTDSNGEAEVTRNLPPGVCGTLLQALDLGSCAVSDVVPLSVAIGLR